MIVRLFVLSLPLLLVAGAVGGWLYGLDTALMVPMGAVGVVGILAAVVSDWRAEGFDPSTLTIGAAGLGMLCGVPIYYFPENMTVFMVFIGLFFLFMILSFAGKVWDLTRKTKVEYAEWTAWRAAPALYKRPPFRERLKRAFGFL